jgi:glycosyltransferase involved in cell wall biosynthesis
MSDKDSLKLSIVVPVFNEGKRLREVFKLLFGSPCPISREWIFINDCSTDNSKQILEKLREQHNFKLIHQTRNIGKGAAIARGVKESTGDYVLIQDADFEYDPKDIPLLLEPLIENQADAVYGSRFKKSGYQIHRTYHYLINRFLTILSNLFSGLYLTDMETCYKIFRADLIKSMNLISKRFGIEVEMTAYLAKTRARVFEIPINYFPRTNLQGKKINWKDGIAALYHLVRFNFFRPTEKCFNNLPIRYNPDNRLENPYA